MVLGEFLLVTRDTTFWPILDQQTLRVDQPNLLQSFFVRHTFFLQSHDDQLGDTNRSLKEKNNPLV
jgi:hypothetical protein